MNRELSLLQYIIERAQYLFEAKLVIASLIAAATFFFDPSQCMAYFALAILICADFVFGYTAAQKTGMQITSAKFFRTPFKFAVYFTLIACCRVSEYGLPDAIAFLDETLVGFLIATELVSILEKAGYLGYAVPKKLLNQLQKYTGEE